MIWMAVTRIGAVISLAAAVVQFYDMHNREIKPNRIYSSQEAARYLGVTRKTVIRMIQNAKLRGKLVHGNYRIPGLSILEYLFLIVYRCRCRSHI